ncbi:MAG: repressor LexA [Nitrospira sp.]|nr:repressor LexA [Nitrospira sp.]
MRPGSLRELRKTLGMTQETLAQTLQRARRSIIRYEDGTIPIPMTVELALMQLSSSQIPLAGVVAAGAPIEPIPQMERVEVPKSMVGRGETFALRVKGTSMQNEGIFPGDIVVVQKHSSASNGQTVIALVNGEATIKTYLRKAGTIELHPANDAMQPIVIKPSDSFQIEGIVVGVIRHLRK